MKKSKSSSSLFSGSSSKSSSPKTQSYEPPKQPKPSYSGGNSPATNVSVHSNHKGDVLLSFGKSNGTKTKKSTKTVVGPDGKKTKQTVVTTTRYYCGGCGETVSGKQCGNCGAKLRS